MKDPVFRSLLKKPDDIKYILRTILNDKIKKVTLLSNNQVINSVSSKIYIPDGLVRTKKGVVWIEYNNYGTDKSYIVTRLCSLIASTIEAGRNTLTERCSLLVFDNFSKCPAKNKYQTSGGFTEEDIVNDKAYFHCVYLQTFLETVANSAGQLVDDSINATDKSKLLFFLARPYEFSRIVKPSAELKRFISIFCQFLTTMAGMKRKFKTEKAEPRVPADSVHDQMFMYLVVEKDYKKFINQFPEVDLPTKNAMYTLVVNEEYDRGSSEPARKKIKISDECMADAAASLTEKLVDAKVDPRQSIVGLVKDMKSKGFHDCEVADVANFFNVRNVTRDDVRKILHCPDSREDQELLLDLEVVKKKHGKAAKDKLIKIFGKIMQEQLVLPALRKSPRILLNRTVLKDRTNRQKSKKDSHRETIRDSPLTRRNTRKKLVAKELRKLK